MKNLTDREIIELIDRSLKATARDVREGRIPLDGRVHFPPPEAPEVKVENSEAADVPPNKPA